MGRPQLPEDKKIKKRCEVLFTEKEWEWLSYSAQTEGYSAPQFIRLLCRKWYIENHSKQSNKRELPDLI